MAVGIDVVASLTGVDSGGAVAGPLNLSHTCGASASLLIAFATLSGGPDAGDGISAYVGAQPMVPFTRHIRSNEVGNGINGYGSGQVFYLLNPPTGSALTISIVKQGGTNRYILGNSISYTGAGAPTAVSVASGNTASAATTQDIDPNQWGAQFCFGGSAFSTTATHTQRFRYNVNSFDEGANMAYQDTSTAGAATAMSQALTADWWGAISFVIPEPSAGAAAGTGNAPVDMSKLL